MFKVQTSARRYPDFPYNTSALPHQPKITKTLKGTYAHWPSTNWLSSKGTTFLSASHDATYQHHHTTIQVTIITPADSTKQITNISALQSTCIYQQHKPTLTCHTDNNHHNTTTIHTNITHLTQQTNHKIQNTRNQTITSKPQHTSTSTPSTITVLHPIPQLFHKQINPIIMNLLVHHSNPLQHK